MTTTTLAPLDAFREMSAADLEAELARLDELRRLGLAVLSVRRRDEKRAQDVKDFTDSRNPNRKSGA